MANKSQRNAFHRTVHRHISDTAWVLFYDIALEYLNFDRFALELGEEVL